MLSVKLSFSLIHQTSFESSLLNLFIFFVMRLFVLYLILNRSAVIYFQLFKANFSLLLQLSLFNKMVSLLASHLRFSCYDCF